MENKPGDGKTSPFGNGQGATSAGASSGGHDFIKDPTGSNKGSGHDFVADPKGSGTGGGADMTKNPAGGGKSAPEQKEGENVDVDEESVPEGGKYRFPQAGSQRAAIMPSPNEKPFKL